jgi:thioredoxin-related protein
MRKSLLWLLLAFIPTLLPISAWAVDGEKVYEQKCAGCHKLYIPVEELMANFTEHNNTKLRLKAPTVNQLAYRLKQRIGDPKGDKDMQLMEVASFVHDYVLHPDRQKSICMPEVLAYFQTMPSLEGKIGDEELEAVAEWLYFYMPPVKKAKKVSFVDFESAKKEAFETGKIIMIEVTSPTCHYCVKMEKTTLKEPDVIEAIERDFIPVRIDVSRQALPAGLSYSMTPTFFFIDSHGRLLKKIPGAWMRDDFLQILREVKKKADTVKDGGKK